jgi:hypothetical protein
MIRRFNRFELKYVVDVIRARAFLADLMPFMRPDRHAGPSGRYRVVSLYYDSPRYHCYRAKVEGLKFRRKLRLRVYPASDGSPPRVAMVEIKQRINLTVQKRRVALALDAAEALCGGREGPLCPEGPDRAVEDEVRTMVAAMQLRPSAVIAYERRPLTGCVYEPGLRVTVDTGVAARVHALDVGAGARNHFLLPPSLCILEVKVNERIPRWLARLLASHDFCLQRVSKYCAGLRRAHAIGTGPLAG